jgi:hypothetical protein
MRRAATPLAGVALAAGALSAACGGGERRTADSATAAPPPRVATNDSTCPKSGQWRLCSVRDRLESAGLVPLPRDSVRQPFLEVPGAAYGVGADELQIYLYADSAARLRDFADFDTLRVQPADTAERRAAHPTLITSNNLAAILLSDSETQIERIQLALTAGLPRE